MLSAALSASLRWTVWTKATRKAWRHAVRGWRKEAAAAPLGAAAVKLALATNTLASGLLVLGALGCVVFAAACYAAGSRYGDVGAGTLLMSAATLTALAWVAAAAAAAALAPASASAAAPEADADEDDADGARAGPAGAASAGYDHQVTPRHDTAAHPRHTLHSTPLTHTAPSPHPPAAGAAAAAVRGRAAAGLPQRALLVDAARRAPRGRARRGRTRPLTHACLTRLSVHTPSLPRPPAFPPCRPSTARCRSSTSSGRSA